MISKHYILRILRNCIVNFIYDWLVYYLKIKIRDILNKYPLTYQYLTNIYNTIYLIHSIYTTILGYTLVYLKNNYPSTFKTLLFFYVEYTKVISGNLNNTHIKLFILTGIILNSLTFIKGFFIMLLAKVLKDYIIYNKDYILNKQIFIKYPFLYDILISFLTSIYILSLYTCMNITYEGLILPLLYKLHSYINYTKNIILNMSGLGGSSKSPNPSPGNNQPQEPNLPPNPSNIPPSSHNPQKSKNKKRKLKKEVAIERMNLSEEDKAKLEVGLEFWELNKACDELCKIGGNHNARANRSGSLNEFIDKYHRWLPSESKKKIKPIIDTIDGHEREKGLIAELGYDVSPDVKTYWGNIRQDNRTIHKTYTKLFQIFDENAKKIKNDNMGGLKSSQAKLFNQELSHLKNIFADDFRKKENFCNKEIVKAKKVDDLMKKEGMPMQSLFNLNILFK